MTNFKSQRGAVELAIVIAIAATTLLAGMILPSKLNPFTAMFGRDAANKKASWTKWNEKMTPKLLSDDKGRPVAVGTEIERVYDTGKEDSRPAPTYGERVGAFFAGLTNFGLLALVAFALLAPGTLIGFLAKRYRDYRALAKTMVAGVKAAPPDAADAVKTEIAIKQDTKQKKMVARLKGELQ